MVMIEKRCRFLLLLVLFCIFCIVPIIADTSTDYWAPWVTNTNTTSVIVNWRGGSNGSGSIDYATSSYYNQHQSFEKTIATQEMATYQHVQLIGLEPNTSYIYWVRPSGNENAFGNRTFRTMPVSGPFTFIVISDSQEGDNYTEWMRFKYVADAVANETDVLFILHGGDYAGHDSKDLWNTYFQTADGMLAKFAIFTTIGNHEYHNSSGGDNPPTNASQYHWSYNVPLNYSFDCADVRFIILDTPDPNNANGDDPHTSLTLAMSQESWLKEQLDNNMSGTFTIHHHPIWDYYNNTSNPDLQPWETLYHTYNISANFAGHTHNYQRYSVRGIPYFIVGDAGGRCADLNASNSSPVWYQFGETRVLGYLKVAVDPANNTATAQEIIVATVQEDDDNETPYVYNSPVVIDKVTFPLKVHQTPPAPGLAANFIAAPLFGSAPLSVTFTDTSTGKPDFWNYDFGDERSSSSKNPVHTYLVPGNYTVTLTILKVEGGVLVRNTTVKENLVTVGGGPEPRLAANFTAEPLSSSAPLRVNFTDASTGRPDFWNYNFGDGLTSTAKNPMHTYRTPGTYTVNLTVMKIEGGTLVRNTTVKQNLITVRGGPGPVLTANFTAEPLSGSAPLKVNFTDASTGRPDFWNYNFGDGLTSTAKNPVHTYRSPGNYTVTLTIMKIEGGTLVRNTTIRQDMVMVGA